MTIHPSKIEFNAKVDKTDIYEMIVTTDACKWGRCIVDVHKGIISGSSYHCWDGNEKEPTVIPSIGCDCRCGLHYRLVKGEILT